MKTMKISKDDFMKFTPKLARRYHKWEVIIPYDASDRLLYRHLKFGKNGFETPMEQYDAVLDVIRGCLDSGSGYYVFCDDKLVVDL